MNDKLLEYICCSKCKKDLERHDNFLVCENCGEKYEIIDGNIIKAISESTPDLELSINKWDEIYQKQLLDLSYIKAQENYLAFYYDDTYQQLEEAKIIGKDLIYLEIGCGEMFLGQTLANQVDTVIGIDICLSSLKIAKKLFDDKGLKNYLLLQGDILNMPIKNNKIDLIYGGGVIEHFRDTQKCVNELYRILKDNGISFNTVPYLNVGSLTYRQIWGNIPNAPILKQLAELIHIKILKAKHMRFGYELSFTAGRLKRLHERAGFKEIKIERYKVKLLFEFIPKRIRPCLVWLANSYRLFWPMVKVVAKK